MRSIFHKLLAKASVARTKLPSYYAKSKKYYPSLTPQPHSEDRFIECRAEAIEHLQLWIKAENKQPKKKLRALVHPYWETTRQKIRAYILKPLPKTFLRSQLIQLNIGWGGTPVQDWHKAGVTSEEISKKVRSFIEKSFTESWVGQPYLTTLPSSDKAVTPGSLQHLSYLGRIDKKGIADTAVLVELGGGYGNLARLTTTAFPEVSYVILDTPESLAIQYTFLKTNCPDLQVVGVHKALPKKLEKHTIYLVPFWYVYDLGIKTDWFISTFALTETTDAMRETIARSAFWFAKHVYIQGGKDERFKSHEHMQDILREVFGTQTVVRDSFIPGCYEVIS